MKVVSVGFTEIIRNTLIFLAYFHIFPFSIEKIQVTFPDQEVLENDICITE